MRVITKKIYVCANFWQTWHFLCREKTRLVKKIDAGALSFYLNWQSWLRSTSILVLSIFTNPPLLHTEAQYHHIRISRKTCLHTEAQYHHIRISRKTCLHTEAQYHHIRISRKTCLRTGYEPNTIKV